MVNIVECVPNFSEGRDKTKINQITQAIQSISGIEVLSVEMGADVNRTVVTFIGTPEAIKEASFQAIKTAAEVIDMSQHHGAHPRMGATDVCPFVPVEGVTMADCVAISKDVAKRVGEELEIPVYLYEESAQKEERRNLANIRHGEYEGLKDKLSDPRWRPDYGPAQFNSRAGATVIGAREFLIAFNINLNTTEKQCAMDIAFELREKGRSARQGDTDTIYMRGDLLKYRKNHYPCGNCNFIGKTIAETNQHCLDVHQYNLFELLEMHDIDLGNPIGRSVKIPGIFRHCKAIGWFVREYKRAQISINLTNYKITPPHLVLEKARELAAARGLIVTGSEVVGLIPFQAMYQAGIYYLKKQGQSTGIPINDIIETAVYSMGLNDVSKFDPQKKILGLPSYEDRPLISLKTFELVQEVSRETPTPGGGSIAALAGSLGAALASMVSNLTIGKKGYQEVWGELNDIAEETQKIKDELLRAVDDDTNAFNFYLEARRLPDNTPEERSVKEKAIQRGLKEAVMVPLGTAQLSMQALKLAKRVVELGNVTSISDAGVGAQIAFTGIRGGIYNVLVNLPQIREKQFRAKMRDTCSRLETEAESLLKDALRILKSRLEKNG
jgi:glutamate formiminotransferase/formiminotetrahydrofolate cyclodeaminase